MPNPDPETLYYTQEDNGECLYKIRCGSASIFLSRGLRPTDLLEHCGEACGKLRGSSFDNIPGRGTKL
jgi:hypothetical protein